MEAVIRKWGNSPALRLPTAVLKEASYRLEQKVNLLVSRGRIIIQPSKKIEYDIDELVNGIHAKNTHDEVSTVVMLHLRAKMKALLQIP